MILHAEFLTPRRLPTTALFIVAFLWVDDARVTLGQFLKTWVAIALIKTLIRFSSAMDAVNGSAIKQLYGLANMGIKGNIFFSQSNAITHLLFEPATHLA
jgi:hypothetical protein